MIRILQIRVAFHWAPDIFSLGAAWAAWSRGIDCFDCCFERLDLHISILCKNILAHSVAHLTCGIRCRLTSSRPCRPTCATCLILVDGVPFRNFRPNVCGSSSCTVKFRFTCAQHGFGALMHACDGFIQLPRQPIGTSLHNSTRCRTNLNENDQPFLKCFVGVALLFNFFAETPHPLNTKTHARWPNHGPSRCAGLIVPFVNGLQTLFQLA